MLGCGGAVDEVVLGFGVVFGCSVLLGWYFNGVCVCLDGTSMGLCGIVLGILSYIYMEVNLPLVNHTVLMYL